MTEQDPPVLQPAPARAWPPCTRADLERVADALGVTDERLRNRRTAVDDYVRRVVAKAPPLSADQRDRLALLLRGKPAPKLTTDADRAREAAAAAARADYVRRATAARQAAAAALACAVCGVPEPGHRPASVVHHEWEPKALAPTTDTPDLSP